MNSHLSAEESVAAVEKTLDPIRAAHLDACDQCRREVTSLEAMLRAVEATSDPVEPSPLFWDHFSARIRDAVGPAPPRKPIWNRWWQPALGLAAAGAVAMILAHRDAGPAPDAGVRSAQSADASVTPDARWDAVVELAADLSVDEVTGAVPLRLDNVVLFDELTPDEQATVAELLQTEMKGLE